MAAKKSSFLNMFLALVLVTLTASIALGFVYQMTKEPIAQAKLRKKVKAIEAVIPSEKSFENNPLEERFVIAAKGPIDTLECYPAISEEQLMGTAIKTYCSNGYSGYIWLMVGFLPDGVIYNIEVLEHKETPGLGTKMLNPEFKGQFVGKNLDAFNEKVKKDGGEVDALSGATITSRAYGSALKKAHNAYQKGGER